MPISQAGALNTTALVVPDLYVRIVPPQNLVINGVPSNRIGVVGTASWGPVGQPIIVGSMADYASLFGPVMARKYDAGTHVATAVQQGASDFRIVRVSDGTDTAASYAVFYQSATANYPMQLTARYTGTLGQAVSLRIDPARNSGTWRLTIGLGTQPPEVFDNIPAPTSAAGWANIVSAVNNGLNDLRGPSKLVVAAIGTAAATVALAALPVQNLLGGTDGAGITAAMLIGQDILPRRGMYSLRGQGCGVIVLADNDDSTTWTTQAGFGVAESAYMIATGPAGDTTANAIATRAAAGLDSPWVKLMHGDWLYWADQVNGQQRLVSPQGFVAGRLANLSPEQSSLNKQLYGVVGSQRSGLPGAGSASTYSTAELSALFLAGIDVIANPQPGGSYWGVRGGRNSSSNEATRGDNYTRMNNYIATTLAAAMGQYIGEVVDNTLFQRIRSTQLSFLGNMLQQGQLGSPDGKQPFAVQCDLKNNPFSRTSLGYVQSDAQVRFQAINEKFIVNLEGGQTVQVSRRTLPGGQV